MWLLFVGRELKNAIIVAYLLEYYSRNATNNVGWMCTVSTAIPLLFKYNYGSLFIYFKENCSNLPIVEIYLHFFFCKIDDYARKLFRKECFADQDYFSAQNPYEIIPKEYLIRHNHNIKFRAFRPMVELESDKNHFLNCLIEKWIKNPINKVVKFFDDLDNNLGKSPL